MPNKKVIRREIKSGKFTTVNFKILRDNNLTSNAKILLIEILSDSDGFRYSEQLYINRMGISKGAYYRALNNLIDNGYVKKSKIQNSDFNYYTISEYGTLKSENVTESSTESHETLRVESKPKKVDSKEEITKKVYRYLTPYVEFINEEVKSLFYEMLDNDSDYYQIKSKLSKAILKVQKAHFKEVKTYIMEKTFSSERNKKEAIIILKDEIFKKNKKTEPYRMLNLGSQKINRRRKLDPESLEADRASGI